MSIDLGTSNIATCYTNSNQINSIQIENCQFKNLEKQASKLQSKLEGKKKYSKRYNRIKHLLEKKQKKVSDKNKDFQHKISKKIVQICLDNNINTLVVGDIQTKKCSIQVRKIEK